MGPAILWLWKAPYGPLFRSGPVLARRAIRSFADVLRTLGEITRQPTIMVMTLLAGGTSFFVGNSYHPQMPGFAHDPGHGDPGVDYSMLLAADTAGAMLAAVALEKFGWLRTSPRMALGLAGIWSLALLGFALSSSYSLAFQEQSSVFLPCPFRSLIGAFSVVAFVTDQTAQLDAFEVKRMRRLQPNFDQELRGSIIVTNINTHD